MNDIFENECHQLDLAILEQQAVTADEDRVTTINFDQQIKAEALRKKNLLTALQATRLQLENIEDDIPLCVQHNADNDSINKAGQLRENIADMVSLKYSSETII